MLRAVPSRPSLDTASAGAAVALSAQAARSGLQRLAATVLTPSRLSLGRAGAGVVLIAAPTRVTRLLGTDAAAARTTSWATQMLGAREIALGAGTALALRRPDRRAARLWVAASLLADAVDALATARATGRGDVRRTAGAGMSALAVTAVAVEAAALAGDDLR